MSNYEKYTPAQRKAWGRKMAAARAAKASARSRPARRAPVAKKRPAARKAAVTGLGAYKATKGANFGTRAGGYLGSKLGEWAGGAAHSLFSSITGLGAYEVKSNVLLAQDPAPMVNKDTHGGVVLRHREYIGDVITSGTAGAFNLTSFAINAAQETTFPFLSQIAQNYESYVFEGLIFEFRSMSADALNSTNTALGSVIMATDYNAGNPVFVSKAEMENYEFGSSCKPSVNMIHPIECEPKQTAISNNLYTRPFAVPAGQAVQLYDMGNFQIATVGFQGTNVNIGELWCTYQVCLLKPKMFTALGNANTFYHSNNLSGVTSNLGTLSTISVIGNTIGCAQVDDREINFPRSQFPQTYFVTVIWSDATGVTWVPPALSTNCALAPFYSAAQAIPQSGVTGVKLMTIQFAITTPQVGIPYFYINAGGTTGTQSCSVRIVQIPNIAV